MPKKWCPTCWSKKFGDANKLKVEKDLVHETMSGSKIIGVKMFGTKIGSENVENLLGSQIFCVDKNFVKKCWVQKFFGTIKLGSQ